MGDVTNDGLPLRLRQADDPAAEARGLPDEAVVEALAGMAAGRSRAKDGDPLARALAAELVERIGRKNAVLEASAEGLMHVDAAGRISYMNAAGLRMAGREAREAEGSTLHGLLQPQDIDGNLIPPEECPIMETIRSAQPTRRLDMLFRRADGTRFPVEYSASPILRDGRVAGAVVAFSDRTDQHQALHTLLRSEARYDRIVESIDEYAIFMLDAGGTIVSWNSGAQRIKGYTESDILGMPFEVLFTEEERADGRPREEMARAADEGRHSGEGWRRRKDGSRFWASVVLTALYDDEGRLRGFVNVTRDLTDRAEMERKLSQRARMQEAVATLGLEALSGRDLQGLMELACETAAKALGADLAILMELLPEGNYFRLRAGHGWKEGFIRAESRLRARPDSVAGYTLHAQAPVLIEDLLVERRFPPPSHLHDHQARSGVGVVVKDGGPPFGVFCVYSRRPRRHTEDEVHFVQSVANTLQLAIHRHAAEEANEKLNALLESRVAGRTEELRLANEGLEAFTYVVSHDLKEPVRAMRAYLQAVREDYDRPEGRDHLNQALKANEQLASLLTGLLQWSRLGMETVELEPLHLPTVLGRDECAVQWENLAHERGAHVDIEENLPGVMATPTMASQIFGNLIVNAIKHNPKPHPLVRVHAGATDAEGAVEIVISDNGAGFPAHVLSRFEKLKENRPSTVRGGFGLVLTRRAMERLGGKMWLSNNPQGGGEVHLCFPPPRRG